MKVHCCLLDSDCRKYGAPARIHISTRWWSFGIALKPGDRFVVRKKDAPPYVTGDKYDDDLYENKWISKGRGRLKPDH